MPSLQRFLVPIDGSPSAERAITLALRLAREHDAELFFCNAVNYPAMIAESTTPYGTTDVSGLFEALDASAKELLTAASARATAAGVTSSAFKLDGRADDAIVAFAVEREVDAIVMGTRGRSGLQHLFLGSTAEGVLRTANVPVFVLPADCAVPGIDDALGFGTILVATDDSDPSEAAAAYATELAEQSGSRLIFSHVIDADMLYEQLAKYGGDVKPIHEEWEAEGNAIVNAAAHRAREVGVTNIEQSVELGEPVADLLKRAQEAHAGVIAIGTHGRRGIRRMLLGSVAENVVRRSQLPVLVVRSLIELPHGRKPHQGVPIRAQLVSA